MDGVERKRFDQLKNEVQFLRQENQHLRLELNACRPELYRADQKIDRLEQRVEKLAAQNVKLKQKLADLSAQLKPRPGSAPASWVKANVAKKASRKPGRKPGHPAALRPPPTRIDVHRTVESRGGDQPPAVDVPHAQLGLNALATAAVMRVCYRLPLRQITRLFAHLPRELRDTIGKRPELASHEFFRRCKRLVQEMLKLKKHRQSLTTFLHQAEVDGTNNAAERALRPAVVMRKITGGSRSASGAQAWAILASVMRTAEQQGRDLLQTIKTLLRAEWAGQDIALLSDAL